VIILDGFSVATHVFHAFAAYESAFLALSSPVAKTGLTMTRLGKPDKRNCRSCVAELTVTAGGATLAANCVGAAPISRF
jgi:hypothetical protein